MKKQKRLSLKTTRISKLNGLNWIIGGQTEPNKPVGRDQNENDSTTAELTTSSYHPINQDVPKKDDRNEDQETN